MAILTTPGLRSALLLTALGVALSAGAQTYKWVDERGVVTYSNTPPPATGGQPKRIDAVAERVSVYTPDAELQQAMKSDSGRDAKIDRLERDLAAARRAHPAGGTGRQNAAYDRCVTERGVDCEALRSKSTASNEPEVAPGYATLYYPPVIGAARAYAHRTRPFFLIEEPRPIGVDNRPKVGIDNRPKVGIDSRPPVEAPPHSHTSSRLR